MFNSELSSIDTVMRKPGRIPSISERNSIMEGSFVKGEIALLQSQNFVAPFSEASLN